MAETTIASAQYAGGSTVKLFLIGAFIMCGSFMFGMDSGATSGFLAMDTYNRDFGTYDPLQDKVLISAQVQANFNLIAIGAAVFVCALSGEIGSRFGRRFGLALTGVAGILSAVIQLVAVNVGTVYAGKVFYGCTIGLASIFVPLYLVEIAPPKWRGVLASLYQMGTMCGQLIAASINYKTHSLPTRWSYRGPFVAEIFFPAVILFFVYLFPESPRHLLAKGNSEKARRAIRRLRGTQYPDEAIIADIADIQLAIADEKKFLAETGYLDLIRGVNRRRTLLAIFFQWCSTYCGQAFLSGYGVYFFSISGIDNPFLVGVLLQVVGVAGVGFSFFVIRYFGRRTVMLVGGSFQALFMFVFAIIATVHKNPTGGAAKALAAVCLLYYFSVNASWANLCWTLSNEMCSTPMRAKTLAVSTGFNWAMVLTILGWLPIALNPSRANLGGKLGYLFGASIAVDLVLLYFVQPETKDRSLEELDELFFQKVSARRFASTGVHLQDNVGDNGLEICDEQEKSV